MSDSNHEHIPDTRVLTDTEQAVLDDLGRLGIDAEPFRRLFVREEFGPNTNPFGGVVYGLLRGFHYGQANYNVKPSEVVHYGSSSTPVDVFPTPAGTPPLFISYRRPGFWWLGENGLLCSDVGTHTMVMRLSQDGRAPSASAVWLDRRSAPERAVIIGSNADEAFLMRPKGSTSPLPEMHTDAGRAIDAQISGQSLPYVTCVRDLPVARLLADAFTLPAAATNKGEFKDPAMAALKFMTLMEQLGVDVGPKSTENDIDFVFRMAQGIQKVLLQRLVAGAIEKFEPHLPSVIECLSLVVEALLSSRDFQNYGFVLAHYGGLVLHRQSAMTMVVGYRRAKGGAAPELTLPKGVL